MAAYFFEIINIKVKIELSLASYFVVFLSTSKLTDTPWDIHWEKPLIIYIQYVYLRAQETWLKTQN